MIDSVLLAPAQRYVPGILGGLGPLSHVAFERELLYWNNRRGARSDQQHPVWLLASASATPDRSAALLHGGPTPVNHLVAFARILEGAGADAVFMICNSAHAFHTEVQHAIGVPLAHLMSLTAEAARRDYQAGAGIGILGTDGTLAAGLYHKALAAQGLVPIAPAPGSDMQRQVMAAIMDRATGIKGTGAHVSRAAKERLVGAADWCVRQGAVAVVAACTEVSIGLLPQDFTEAPIVDPLKIAANAALDLAFGMREPSSFH